MQNTVFLIIALGLGLVYCCDENQIQQCIQQFTRSVGGADASAIKTEQQIDNACSKAFPTLRTCLKRSSKDCPQTIRMMFEGLTDTFDFVCGEGREEQIEHGECLGSTDLRNEANACQSTLNRKMAADQSSDMDKKCGYINEFLDCAFDAAEEECGEDAAEYQKEVTKMATGPMIDSIGCEINASSRTLMGWTVACVVVLQSLVLYMSF